MLAKYYQNIILKNPKLLLILLFLFLITGLNYSKNFKLDASSETLLLEGDPDLKYLKEINERYNSREFLVLTYTPNEKMISDQSINNLLSLKYKLQSLEWVHSVITLLDVPLLNSTDDTLSDKLSNDLTQIGHKIVKRKTLGRMDCILVREDGSLEGGADKRGDDYAASY